jgi:hypothetical protein
MLVIVRGRHISWEMVTMCVTCRKGIRGGCPCSEYKDKWERHWALSIFFLPQHVSSNTDAYNPPRLGLVLRFLPLPRSYSSLSTRRLRGR